MTYLIHNFTYKDPTGGSTDKERDRRLAEHRTALSNRPIGVTDFLSLSIRQVSSGGRAPTRVTDY